jgi:4'-phosphopantetheinyl transferase
LLGLGLNYPTQNLTVQGLSQSEYLFLDPMDPNKKEWGLLPFMPKVGYAAALCYHPCIQEIYYTEEDTVLAQENT